MKVLNILSPEFTSNYGRRKGVYLITTNQYYLMGVCKVGLTATSFNSRFKSYRAHYSFAEPIYCFGLIVLEEKTQIRSIEKSILKRFEHLRIPYPDTERQTEWLRISAEEIKTVFDEYRNHEGVLAVETEFGGLKNAPPLTIVKQVLPRKERETHKVEYWDGTIVPAQGALADVKQSLTKAEQKTIKDLDPELVKWLLAHDITLLHIANEVRILWSEKQIKDKGGIEQMVIDLAKEAKRRNATDLRQIRHYKRVARFES